MVKKNCLEWISSFPCYSEAHQFSEKMLIRKKKVLAIPKHVLRSYAKANPSLHEQLYDPTVLLHLC